MRKLLATTLTVLAASGCAANAPDVAQDDPPPSSRRVPISHRADVGSDGSEDWSTKLPPKPDTDPSASLEASASGPPIPPIPPTSNDPSDMGYWPPSGFTADVQAQEPAPASAP